MQKKDRYGIHNSHAKTNELDVALIRYLSPLKQWTERKLSFTFGLSVGAIHNIISRSTWKNVETDKQINNFLARAALLGLRDRKSTRLNSSHQIISYAVFCLKKKKQNN